MKQFSALFALLALSLVATSADASIVQSLLSFDGTADIIADESRGLIAVPDPDDGSDYVLADASTDRAFADGDRVFGIVKITDINNQGTNIEGSIHQVYGLFGFELAVDSTTGLITNDAIAYDADYSIYHMMKNEMGFLDSDLTDFQDTAKWSDTVFAIIESDSEPSDPFAKSVAPLGSGGAYEKLSKDEGFSPAMSLGFGADPNDHGDTDFSEVDPDVFGSGSFTTIGDIISDASTAVARSMFDEYGGFTVLTDIFGDIVYKPVVAGHAGGDPADDSSHDFAITEGAVNTVDSSTMNQGWHLSDEIKGKVNAVPEPSSLLVWCGLMVTVGFAARRRKRLTT